MKTTHDITPASNDAARVDELLGRVKERLGEVPQAYRTLALSQTYLNDTLYNLRKMMVEGALDLKTKQMIALGVATATGGRDSIDARVAEASADGLSDDEIAETFAVAGSIATYNVFYKFQHLAGAPYDGFRPGFKVSVFLRPNHLTQLQVEVISAMISTVNGCHSCVQGHVAKCRELGMTPEQLEEGLRVAALVAGISTVAK